MHSRKRTKRYAVYGLLGLLALLTMLCTTSCTSPSSAGSVATLSSLSLIGSDSSAVSLSPAFSPSTYSYTASTSNSITSVTVSATATDSKATVTGTGASNLNVGSNTISVKVTAQDGTTTKTYTITDTRAGYPITDFVGTWAGTSTGGDTYTLIVNSDASSTYRTTSPYFMQWDGTIRVDSTGKATFAAQVPYTYTVSSDGLTLTSTATYGGSSFSVTRSSAPSNKSDITGVWTGSATGSTITVTVNSDGTFTEDVDISGTTYPFSGTWSVSTSAVTVDVSPTATLNSTKDVLSLTEPAPGPTPTVLSLSKQ